MTRYVIIGKNKPNNLYYLARNETTNDLYWTTCESRNEIIFLWNESTIENYIRANASKIREECESCKIISVGYMAISSAGQEKNYIFDNRII